MPPYSWRWRKKPPDVLISRWDCGSLQTAPFVDANTYCIIQAGNHTQQKTLMPRIYRSSRLWPLFAEAADAAFHSHGVDSNYTRSNMFETHKQNHAFANSPRCNLTPLEWMCLSVTSLSDRSEGRKKKKKTTGAFNFQLSGKTRDATVRECFITKLCEVLQEKWNGHRFANWNGHAPQFPLG